MKKISTLLISSLFSLSLLAYDGSRLSISTVSTGMNLKIEVDGQRVFMQGNQITLSNLDEGNHNVRIYREKKRDDFGTIFGRKYEIIYATSVYISRLYYTQITVNSYGKAFVESYRIDADNDCYDANNNGYYKGNDKASQDSRGTSYSNVISDREFSDVKDQIAKEWSENGRLVSVKTIMDKNNFTTCQVKDLMLLFTSDNNRLEVAKYAYCKTADQQNFFQVNDVLASGSAKDELARFIRESR